MSKSLIFMIAVTLTGVGGSLAVSPFYGVAVYYLFAVLRPQFIWQWSLPPDVAWSFYVAIAAMIGLALNVRSSKEAPADSSPAWRLSAAHWAIVVFAVWVSITYVTALNRDKAYPVFVEYLKVFVMFWVGARVVRTTRQVWVLYLLAAGALGYIAYEINFTYIFQGQYDFIYQNGYGGLDNNGAGLMLAMGVPLCYFAWEGIRRWYRWAFLALVPFIIHAVLLSYSRGAMVSLLAGVPFYILRSRRKVLLLVILAGIAVMVPALAGKEVRARFFTLENTEVDESANLRRGSMAAGWRIAQDYPVFGVGLRNADLLSHAYGADRQGRTIHSLYIQTAADSGFVGLGLYIGVLAAFWWSTYKARRQAAKRSDEEGRQAYAAACGVEGAMIVFCAGAAFLSFETFETPYLMLLIGAQLPLVLRAAPSPDAAAPAAATDASRAACAPPGTEPA